MATELTDTEKDRFKAIKLLLEGKSRTAVAKIMHRPVKWVKRTENRWKEQGNFKDRFRKGAPRKMTPRDEKALVKKVEGKSGHSTRREAGAFMTAKKERVSRETVRKVYKGAGLYPHRRRKVVLLTPKQKVKRVNFASKYRRFDWTKCAFWDETEFELHPTPNIKNDITWDKRGQVYKYEKMAHPPKFKFGAAITAHGATRLVSYTGTIDSKKYMSMVDQVIPDLKKLFGKTNFTYIHDGATCHTSKETMEHLRQVLPSLLPKGDWPPNSPDDNPIENVFGYLESKVQEKKSDSLAALEKRIRSAWNGLTPEYLKSCIEVIPKRLKQIIASNGEYVDELK
jgi:transposase